MMDQEIQNVRASSIAEIMGCAHGWEGKYLLGMRIQSSGAASIGSAVHASTAQHDRDKLWGIPLDGEHTAGIAVDYLRQHAGETDWGDIGRKRAEKVALLTHALYCEKIAPQFSYRSVEKKLNPLVVNVNGVHIRLTGTLDREYTNISGDADIYGIADVKTGKGAVSADGLAKLRGHGAQIGVYELLAAHTNKVRPELPAVVLALSTGSKGRVACGTIDNAREQMTGDDKSPGYLDYIAQKLKSGLYPPNPNSILCNEKYCARWTTCKYRG